MKALEINNTNTEKSRGILKKLKIVNHPGVLNWISRHKML